MSITLPSGCNVSVRVDNSRFVDLSAGVDGAALFLQGPMDVYLYNAEFKGNKASSVGSALSIVGEGDGRGSFTVINSSMVAPRSISNQSLLQQFSVQQVASVSESNFSVACIGAESSTLPTTFQVKQIHVIESNDPKKHNLPWQLEVIPFTQAQFTGTCFTCAAETYALDLPGCQVSSTSSCKPCPEEGAICPGGTEVFSKDELVLLIFCF